MKNEHGDEIVERVDARQHFYARPVGQGGDFGGEGEKIGLGDLEQFLARKTVERRHKRLAGMAFRIEAGAAHDGGNLAPDEWHLVMRLAQRLRGEQPENAQFPGQPAFFVVKLGADIIHVAAPVDAGTAIGSWSPEAARGWVRKLTCCGVIST